MNFAYGVIVVVGALIAVNLAFIAADPGYLVDPAAIMETAPVEPEPVMPPPSVSMPEGSSSPGCESTNECFIPYELHVNVGDTVTWSNDDVGAHTVTSGTLETLHDGIFDSGLFMPGAMFEFTFESPGEYDYFCIVHPWMVGKIIVT